MWNRQVTTINGVSGSHLLVRHLVTGLVVLLGRVAFVVGPCLRHDETFRFVLLMEHVDNLEDLVHLEVIHIFQLLDVLRDVR